MEDGHRKAADDGQRAKKDGARRGDAARVLTVRPARANSGFLSRCEERRRLAVEVELQASFLVSLVSFWLFHGKQVSCLAKQVYFARSSPQRPVIVRHGERKADGGSSRWQGAGEEGLVGGEESPAEHRCRELCGSKGRWRLNIMGTSGDVSGVKRSEMRHAPGWLGAGSSKYSVHN